MQKIFLETSFFSFLDAPDAPIQQAETRALYDLLLESNSVQTITSSEVIRELEQCYEPKRQFITERARRLCDILPTGERDSELMLGYLSDAVLTQKSAMDLLHVAVAVLNDCSLILSWNMKHLANFRIVERINRSNYHRGLCGVQIITPHVYFLEDNHE